MLKDEVRRYGFRSVRDFVGLSGVPYSTLRQWHDHKPELLQIVLTGTRQRNPSAVLRLDLNGAQGVTQ